jgi:hypothetical protein
MNLIRLLFILVLKYYLQFNHRLLQVVILRLFSFLEGFDYEDGLSSFNFFSFLSCIFYVRLFENLLASFAFGYHRNRIFLVALVFMILLFGLMDH